MAQLPPETRLGPPRFESEAADVYEQALTALGRSGVPVLLGGALALNAYTGIWRDTKDLDFFCRPADGPRALAALREVGFETEIVYESWLGKGWRDQVFVDVIWRNANGLFPVSDEWFQHAHPDKLFGHDVLILPLEEFILSKMMVGGRYRFDGADILHVLYAAADRMDWRRLERIAGEHVGLLLAYLHMFRWGYPGWADKVPLDVMDRLEERARTIESTYGPFRGRLLDIQSFQVDVDAWGMPDPHRQALLDIFGVWEGRS